MSSSIFDHMGSEQDLPKDEREGKTFKLMFSTEEVDVVFRSGMTLRDAFVMNAEFLGFDLNRNLTYRDSRNNIYSGAETPEAGTTYIASITHDEKG